MYFYEGDWVQPQQETVCHPAYTPLRFISLSPVLCVLWGSLPVITVLIGPNNNNNSPLRPHDISAVAGGVFTHSNIGKDATGCHYQKLFRMLTNSIHTYIHVYICIMHNELCNTDCFCVFPGTLPVLLGRSRHSYHQPTRLK